jgi:hypothetical protein
MGVSPQPELDWLTSTAPKSVTVLSGAGVSVEGPSSLPTGEELTKRIFSAYFPPDTLGTVLETHQAIGWTMTPQCLDDPPSPDPRPPGPRLPRLETVLGIVARVHGEQAVEDSVGDVADATPNRLHYFLARHIALGGGHLTANFDRCVEKAGAALGHGMDNDRILHFHGSTGTHGEVLGATLERIEKGFPPDLAEHFVDGLRARPVLLIVGYSGSDFFDVDVAIRRLAPGDLTGIRALWLLHDQHAPHFVTPHDGLPPLVTGLRQAGATVDVLCGPSSYVLDLLSQSWAFPPLGDPGARRLSPPQFTVDDSLREVAALELFLELGMFTQVEGLLAAPPAKASPALIRSATSAALWELGRWNDLRRYWTRFRPTTAEERIRRLERIGATWWVQGRLVPAYLWLTWHRRKAEGEARQVFAETEGRVLEHMLRTPDLAWFAKRAAKRQLDVLETPGQEAGVRPYRTRSDLRSSLEHTVAGSPRDDHAAVSSSWFSEAGSLLAWVTYRHRTLRDTYDSSVDVNQLKASYSELRKHYSALGSLSGAMRTILLPGAERVFTTREVRDGLRGLQYGPWHRFRILVRHLSAKHLSERRQQI